MNLVQIQDRIKNYPIQLLQQYANGMNPEVPPYIALSVLKQKEAEMQQHANAQGAAQGQMPSVKSQLEQKVGTLQQQASMMPQGMAQPAAQPPQAPVQAASGGLMSGNAGSSMKFAEGGIIGYSGKGESHVKDKYETPYDRERRIAEEEGTSGLGNALLYASTPVAAAADIASLPVSLLRNMFYNGQGEAPGWTPLSDARARALQGDRVTNAVERAADTTEERSPTEQDVLAAMQRPTGKGTPYVGMLGQGEQAPTAVARPAAARPPIAPGATPGGINQPAPTAAPGGAGLGASSVAAMLQKQLGKEPTAPTAEGAAKSVQDINKQFGLDTPAGKEEREMIAQMRAQREAQMKDRGFNNLVSFLTNARGSNIGETLASGARSSQSEIEKQRADDMAHQQKMYEMVSGLNKANRAEQVGSAGKAATLFGEQEKAVVEGDRNRLTALANIYHTDVASAAQIKAQQIAAASRSGQLDDKQQLAELKALQASIQAQIKLTPFDKKVVGPLQEQLASVNSQIAKMAGVSTMQPAPGAANAGGNAALYSKADAILNGKK